MNKLLLGGIGIVVVAVIGFAVMHKSSPSDQAAESASPSAAGASAMSASELLASGKDQQCTFSRTDVGANGEGTTMGGTMYISKGHMRGDFDITTAGQKIQSHMI